ncbi:hypothetical protein DERF_011494 [Dermatophagoides farinae]|uniref:Uncharacterized protein n=1 Tax=Dermatophagoides farinae TaxID=6954 RepID=A0A922HUN7_DERFA|nr:hypothetical protein DERF_011494 [Dermatophagoides farinae]
MFQHKQRTQQLLPDPTLTHRTQHRATCGHAHQQSQGGSRKQPLLCAVASNIGNISLQTSSTNEAYITRINNIEQQ